MSSTDDASSRLSNALEDILATPPPTADWDVDDTTDTTETTDTGDTAATGDTADDPASDVAPAMPAASALVPPPGPAGGPAAPTYDLPEIVPATVQRPLTESELAATASSPVLPPTVSPATPPTVTPPPPPQPQPAAPAAPAAPQRPPATSWADHMTAPLPGNAQGSPLRAPGRRPRVRRVTRVLRHVDPWSTFKVGLLFSVVAYVVGLTAGVLLWQVADSTGTLDNIERWFTQFGWETFELKGGEIFHNAWIIGLFGVVALTGGFVLLATLFNLVSDIVGGVRVTVLEEEVVERTVSSTRRYVVRRPPLGADQRAASEWDVDGGDDAARAPESDGGPDRETARSEPTATTAAGATEAATDWSVDDD